MRTISINGKRLNEAIIKAGSTLYGISVYFGRGHYYLSSCIKRGRIDRGFYEAMCEELNLNPKDYIDKTSPQGEMANRKRNTTLIDGNKFSQDLKESIPKGANFSTIGRAFKMSNSWLGSCITRGRIGREFLEGICFMYGLTPEDYIISRKLPDAEAPKEKPERNIPEADAYDLLLMIDELNRKINDLQSKGDVA